MHDYPYITNKPGWLTADFSKFALDASGAARRADVAPKLQAVWHRQLQDGSIHVVTKVSRLDKSESRPIRLQLAGSRGGGSARGAVSWVH